MRHTFDSITWQTWGDGPVVALAVRLERGLVSQVGGDLGYQGFELISPPVLPDSPPFIYIVSKRHGALSGCRCVIWSTNLNHPAIIRYLLQYCKLEHQR